MIHPTVPEVLQQLGIASVNHACHTGTFSSSSAQAAANLKTIYSAADGKALAQVSLAAPADYYAAAAKSKEAFSEWRTWPAPRRGEVIRQLGDKLREHKAALGMLVTLETGKIYQEGLGEVQEMIDICDFAVGLSRQLYGFTMHSERPQHRMYDQYHPLGVVGIISAFNFPVAVWAWNAALAAVCGNACIWKPSEKTPLTALACQNLIRDILVKNSVPEGTFSLIIGDGAIGQLMSEDDNIALVSATGSTRVGKKVAATVASRFGRYLLELGGNNAVIITESANLDMAIRSTVFGAVGTAGQRCTSTRRLIVHESRYEEVKSRLLATYPKLPIGNPLEASTLVGPLVDTDAVANFKASLASVQDEGGKLLTGGSVLEGTGFETGTYVTPAIVEAENSYPTVQHETFAPILYLIKYSGGAEVAISIQNDVKQGLSSAMFTTNLQQAEHFLAATGSDCGIANINIGTSGAEIGGAFGGEKETGGGRESGSDAWKVYMRRQTNTINYSDQLPLAQGIKFSI